MKLFFLNNFTRHHLITHTNMSCRVFVFHMKPTFPIYRMDNIQKSAMGVLRFRIGEKKIVYSETLNMFSSYK